MRKVTIKKPSYLSSRNTTEILKEKDKSVKKSKTTMTAHRENATAYPTVKKQKARLKQSTKKMAKNKFKLDSNPKNDPNLYWLAPYATSSKFIVCSHLLGKRK